MKSSLWRKTLFIMIACVLASGLVYGAVMLGDAPVSAEVSKSTQGQFVSLENGNKSIKLTSGGSEAEYPIAANVWVYRNLQKASLSDLQKGDQVELILNSKEQAAYVKASSETAAAAEDAPVSNAAPVPAPEPAPTQVPVTTPTPAPAASSGSAAPKADQAAPAAAAGTGAWAWEKLEVELESRELKLKIEQKAEDAGKKMKTDIYVQTKDRAVIRLTDAAAEQLLRMLLQGLPSDRAAWEKGLKERLSAQFGLKSVSPDWKVEVKWKEDGPSGPPGKGAEKASEKAQGKAKGHEKDKGPDKEKGYEKNKDKGKDNGHDDDD
ncbi:hypothetical protein RAC89_11290 [Paenibacillus sp. GD4]|uniref:hypothetical protein n=1 Tax=Paenibacillus sp. GD4 TaxID=3068890 RepID=UPI002796DB4C|nr:hypothetical protein [Paenibacillus sp. GD4]MDQ1911035.1 hypothetical protein [Paenibacillus sp. GD4]